MCHDPNTKWICLILVFLQLFLAVNIHKANTVVYFLTLYILGATITQSLFLAIHESSHNLIFKKPITNKLFSLFLNIPIVIPFSIAFRHYHLDHHKYQGVDGIDTDLPTDLELLFFSNPFSKLLWLSFQIVVYALRPIVYGKKVLEYNFMLLLNISF